MAGSVENRGKNSWRLTVYLNEKDKNGEYKRERKTVTAKNKTEAKKLLTAFENEILEGEYIAPSYIEFRDYVEIWRKEATKKLAPKTVEIYNYMLNARVIPAFSHIRMEDISPDRISDFLEELEEEELSTSTIQKYFNVLRNIFNFAVKNETIKNSPMDKVEKPSVKYKEGQVYNKTELKQLYQLLDKEENKQMVLLIKTALKTGMRKGELLALRKSDLDYNKNIIHIKHSLSHTKEYGIQLKEPKTKGSNRKIAIPEQLMKELKKHILNKFTDRSDLQELWEGGQDIFVFSSEVGEPFYPTTPYTWWRRFLARINRELKANEEPPFKKIRFHDLRHTFATDLIDKGANINKISKYLGHASITTTSDIYSHLIEGDREISDLVAEDYN